MFKASCYPQASLLASWQNQSISLSHWSKFLLIQWGYKFLSSLFCSLFSSFPSSPLSPSSLYSPPSLWVDSVWLGLYCVWPSNTLHTATHAEYTHTHKDMLIGEPLSLLILLGLLNLLFISMITWKKNIVDHRLQKLIVNHTVLCSVILNM